VDILENQFARVRSTVPVLRFWLPLEEREGARGGRGRGVGASPPDGRIRSTLFVCLLASHPPQTRSKIAMAEARYGGAYVPKEAEPVDPKPAIDAACHSGCTKAWDIYKECEARIEAKGRGECSGYYMDYFKCIDHCATKKLFKALN
jgi:ubiquinol-cytochrome c reductase subunit 6